MKRKPHQSTSRLLTTQNTFSHSIEIVCEDLFHASKKKWGRNLKILILWAISKNQQQKTSQHQTHFPLHWDCLWRFISCMKKWLRRTSQGASQTFFVMVYKLKTDNVFNWFFDAWNKSLQTILIWRCWFFMSPINFFYPSGGAEEWRSRREEETTRGGASQTFFVMVFKLKTDNVVILLCTK